jgi:predicted enzyme related to lactoylglutathione lyase
MSHRISHFEIPADEPALLAEFYRQLFDWQIRPIAAAGFDYWACSTGEGEGIDGAITRRLTPNQGITNYVSVEDILAVEQKARSLGARVLVSRSAVAGMGWYALLADPQGNPIGLWQKDPRAGLEREE